MGFDFANYSYSGLLSLISALFSIAYPILISRIEEIDTKHKTTLLSARLKKESTLQVFRFLIVVNLACVVIIPFLMYGSNSSYIYLIIQGVLTTCLISSTFCLFHTLSHYGNISDLHKSSWEKFMKIYIKGGKKEEESQLFAEWVDVSKTILSTSDQHAARNVYQQVYEYLGEFYQNHKTDGADYDLFFYNGITRINETLCQMPNVPISVNNNNGIINSLIFHDIQVTHSTYTMLWMNLRIQLYYGKEDWVMAYWAEASQKYNLFLHIISDFDVDTNTGKRYTKDEAERREKERWEFLRFNIMFCAMVMKMGQYNLLSRMLSFTQSQPPSYPLVPSRISDITNVFHQLYEDHERYPFLMENMYQMPGMNGISDGKILGAAFEFISLLILRVYKLRLPYGARYAMNTRYVSQDLYDLSKYRESMEILQSWTERTMHNKKLLRIIGIDNWNKAFSSAKESYGEELVGPEILLKNIINNTDDQVNELRKNLPYDEEKVQKIINEICVSIEKGLIHFGDFFKDKVFKATKDYWINGSINTLYPNAAFVKNPDISYVGIDDYTCDYMLRQFKHSFASTFVMTKCSAYYNIDSQDVFECFDRLQIGEYQIIVSFDIFWDYYLDRNPDLKKEDESHYSYKNVRILNLTIGSQLMSRQFYVLKYDELPYLTFEKPNTEQLQKYCFKKCNTQYGVWISLQKIIEHPELISEEERAILKDDPNEMSIFSTYFVAKCHWAKDLNMVKIQVKQKMIDNGNIDDVKNVKPYYCSAMTIEQLNKKLKSIGKAMFRDVLYNEIMANPNVTAEEILSRHPQLKGLSLDAFRTRVSNAKTIFQNGADQEALDIIANSRAK